MIPILAALVAGLLVGVVLTLTVFARTSKVHPMLVTDWREHRR